MPPPSTIDLSGQAVLVAGGNAGIGLGMAHALAAAGADVAIWGRTPENNAEARRQLEAHGTRVVALTCDVGIQEQVERAFSETVARLGRVDTCFANAAHIPEFTPFLDQTAEQWRTALEVNVVGTFCTLQAAARHMTSRGTGGSLVAVSSIAGIYGVAKNQSYSASKAGVTAMINGLAVELGRFSIRANAILPGFVETRATTYLDSALFHERVMPRIPLRRWGTPDDLGGIAIFLASPLSAYHTGGTFVVDGGYSRM